MTHWNKSGSLMLTDSHDSGNAVQVVVFRRIGGSLEHIQHALGDDEATGDVDGGDEGGNSGQSLGRRVGHQSAAHDAETTGGGETGNGVGDAHKGGVQGGGHAPHRVVTRESGQAEGRHHLREGVIRRRFAQRHDGTQTGRVGQRVLERVAEVIGHFGLGLDGSGSGRSGRCGRRGGLERKRKEG